MPESPAAVFERLNAVDKPRDTRILFDAVHVLGGSIAGLLAARVLADHSRTVTIIERDTEAAGAEQLLRSGVPQGFQLHSLLPAGLAQIERWYPTFVQDALDLGTVFAGPDGFEFYEDDVVQPRVPRSRLLLGTRPFNEALLRRHTLALPNVQVVTGQATGLVYEGDAVRGVRYTSGGGERTVRSDFVVEATGRSSRLSEWLERDDWSRPGLERMKVDISYVSARFERGPGSTDVFTTMARYGPHRPEGPAVAVYAAVEDDLWSVMIGGYGEAGRRLSQGDFTDHCAGLPGHFQEVLNGSMVGEPKSYRHPDSRRRIFIDLERFPARLVAIGDAAASFNPIYGQGMTSAALQASALSEYLRTAPDLSAPAREFFRLQKVVVDAAWETSSVPDAARLGLPASQTIGARIQQWLLHQVIEAATRDVDIAQLFRDVAFMVVHPAAIASPRVVARTLLINLKAGLSTEPVGGSVPSESSQRAGRRTY
jgi:2-polyprenyl-6-methoxyphenol hydroxylase-like FAD-dependent oxidoreductase